MATKPLSSSSSSLLFFLALLSTLSPIFITSSNADGTCAGSGAISVYWGQHTDEGTLKDTCDSENYNIVLIKSLLVYDNGSDPTLNLANHCGTAANPCSNLESEIKYCQQNKSIKVFLSIGSDTTASSPPEQEDLTDVLAQKIVDEYLSGNSGPLGSVSLDGIDLQDVSDSKHIHWDELVEKLKSSVTDRKIYISASPECVYPDHYLDAAIQTGYVDYIWVEFYYPNPCIYADGNPDNLFQAWKTWTESVPNSLIFLGLTADNSTAGYIEPDVVNTVILPHIKTSSNYGGVMIFDRYSDIKNDNYSAKIKDSVPKVCRCVCDEVSSSARYRFDSKLKIVRS